MEALRRVEFIRGGGARTGRARPGGRTRPGWFWQTAAFWRPTPWSLPADARALPRFWGWRTWGWRPAERGLIRGQRAVPDLGAVTFTPPATLSPRLIALASASGQQGRLAAAYALGRRPGKRRETDDGSRHGLHDPGNRHGGRHPAGAAGPGLSPTRKGLRPGTRTSSRAGIAADEHGMLSLLFDPTSGHLLGVHIVGDQACELIHIGQAAMRLPRHHPVLSRQYLQLSHPGRSLQDCSPRRPQEVGPLTCKRHLPINFRSIRSSPGLFVKRQNKNPGACENGVRRQPLTRTQGFCMQCDTAKQSGLFENVSKKAVTVRKSDQDHASSDGGAVLLQACAQKLK